MFGYNSRTMEHAPILHLLTRILEVQEKMLLLMREQGKVQACTPGKNDTSYLNEWLDSNDVKRTLKIGESALYRMRNQHAIPCKKVGKKWYYSRTALQAMVSSEAC